jgi:hypothetical protein
MPDDGTQRYDFETHQRERKGVQTGRRFEPLLDAEEAAKLLRMHPRTLRAKARAGAIPGV